nr:CocE/NonD family hydrolase [Streptomyces lanatus]
MVYTRGFGRSTGCPDFGEPGEQADVKAAINWSAKQSWSHRRSGHERQAVRRVQTSSYLQQ